MVMKVMVMAMVLAMMIAMVMLLVMVITVLEAVGEVGCLCQRQHRSFHKLRLFHRPKASRGLLVPM
jgi:hypothetical protein